MSHKVKLTYFKKSGKYYSEGEYITEKEHMFEIFDEVSNMRVSSKLPGTSHGADFIVFVECPGHENEFPALIWAQ